MKNFILLIAFFFIFGHLPVNCLSPVKSISNVIEVEKGVYTGQGKAKSGETIYFGMEKIDASNKKNWEKYVQDVNTMIGYHKSIVALARNCAPDKRPDYSLVKELEFTGFTPKEYNDYINKLYNTGFNQYTKNRRLESVGGGTAGFSIDSTGQYYVVYASKKPIKGKFCFPKINRKITTIKQFHQYYSDILMIMRSHMKYDAPYYENRGIFRNPASIIDGGYSGISMYLHGFTGEVAHKYFPFKKYMLVMLTEPMQKIILPHLKKGDAFIGCIQKKTIKAPIKIFPPIVHIHNGLWKIAKEDVNLTDYVNRDLPPSKTQSIHVDRNSYFDGSGTYSSNGVGEDFHLIKVAALQKLYNESLTKPIVLKKTPLQVVKPISTSKIAPIVPPKKLQTPITQTKKPIVQGRKSIPAKKLPAKNLIPVKVGNTKKSTPPKNKNAISAKKRTARKPIPVKAGNAKKGLSLVVRPRNNLS